MLTTCKVVSRSELLKSCMVCRRFQKDHTIWNFINPETTKAWKDLLKHVKRLHPEALEHDNSRELAIHMEILDSGFLSAVREGKSECEQCKTLEQRERTIRERDTQNSWEHEVSRLLHEYEAHDVPHREITGRDNYFMSISEVSKFANPQFTKHIKAIVKGRARYRCECCGRSWTDVTWNKPVASICHGPWTLASAGVVKGRRLTSYWHDGVPEDVKAAGGKWEDAEVVVDGKLVTSRWPMDLPAFMREVTRVIKG
jgi:DJ-1/PfpI family protein